MNHRYEVDELEQGIFKVSANLVKPQGILDIEHLWG